MNYRDFTSDFDFNQDYFEIIHLVGEKRYLEILNGIRKKLNAKVYVTPAEDLLFFLELGLFNIEINRVRSSSKKARILPLWHEASDLVIGLGQTLRKLSPGARERLKGQFIGGLRKGGLRPLHHELRTANRLCRLGADVRFNDLETGTGVDFITIQSQQEWEVEAKSISIFTGQRISPLDADKCFDYIRRKTRGLSDRSRTPIIDIVVPKALSMCGADLLEIARSCTEVCQSGIKKILDNGVSISLSETLTDDKLENFKKDYINSTFRERMYIYIPPDRPNLIVRLKSLSPPKFFQRLTATISDSAKTQFTGARPGVIVVNIEHISSDFFQSLTPSAGSQVLASLANAVFRSHKRAHIRQLIFTGGASQKQLGIRQYSTNNMCVFNSPMESNWPNALFPGGHVRSSSQFSDR
ncbi:hypothetical protein [Komagataeibacter europaeus]|uniref:hypothetical protein n=1 Tax=Komagataeibacter europaeus TaxID=33995 RepID=UPI0002EE339D|nr:hypothetical protein [Komagataeibacter europaeus]GBQ43032.1 hypothetical protein AA18890_1765 [Komagataeibacter europaeus LMG 18890]